MDKNRTLLRVILIVLVAVSFAVTGILFLGACSGEKPVADGKLIVSTTIFPIYDMARAVGGDDVTCSILIPPGAEPHSFEPTPMDIVNLERADVFIYNGAHMEPWVDDILAGVKNPDLLIVDTSRGITLLSGHMHEGEGHEGEEPEGHDEEGADPHIWLDFDNAKMQIDTISEALINKDPAHREGYLVRAEAYKKAFDDLDALYRDGLTGCRDRVIVSSGHFSFGYLAHRYGIEFTSVFGISPDAEPTPARISSVVETIKKSKSPYIFAEEMVEPRVAETIREETGAEIIFVNAGHEISKDRFDRGVTLVDLMKENLVGFKKGLQCP